MRIVSSRSGLVDRIAAEQPINSSKRRTYLMAWAGSSAHGGAVGVFSPPAPDGLVNRLDARLDVLAGGQIVDLTAIQPIGDTDFDLFKAVQDVEFGERQALNAAGAHGLAHQNGVEPA